MGGAAGMDNSDICRNIWVLQMAGWRESQTPQLTVNQELPAWEILVGSALSPLTAPFTREMSPLRSEEGSRGL